MVMEVCCGQCNGRLLVDTPGVVVACPHCGVHLSVPLPDDDPNAVDTAGESPTTPSVPDPAANPQQVSVNAVVTDSIASSSPIVSTQTPVASTPDQPIATHPAPTSSIFGGPEDEESEFESILKRERGRFAERRIGRCRLRRPVLRLPRGSYASGFFRPGFFLDGSTDPVTVDDHATRDLRPSGSFGGGPKRVAGICRGKRADSFARCHGNQSLAFTGRACYGSPESFSSHHPGCRDRSCEHGCGLARHWPGIEFRSFVLF